MGIVTLLRYLIGDREAILTLAAHPRAWLVGLMFVLSAGFAREYDAEDLVHDPWYLLLPLGASLVSSFLLFCILDRATGLFRSNGPPFFAGYRAFLGLFWLTAPLAWLYAIPYERFLDPLAATQANLATLSLVSIWRVALMVRVTVVLMNLPVAAALFRVVAYADTVALLAVFFLPFPIIEIMGGVHVSEADAAVRAAAGAVVCWGGLLFLPAMILAVILPGKVNWHLSEAPAGADLAVSWPLRILAAASLLIWVGVLPFTQPEQQLRRRVEAAFGENHIADGLALMSAHQPDKFPPHWTPPPRFLKGERMTMVIDIWQEILLNEPAPWVRQRYVDRLKDYLETHRWRDPEKMAEIINQLPEASIVLRDIENERKHRMNVEHLYRLLRPDLQPKKNPDDR